MNLRRRLNRLDSDVKNGPKRPKMSRIQVIDAFATGKEADGAPAEKKVVTLLWQPGGWRAVSCDGRDNA